MTKEDLHVHTQSQKRRASIIFLVVFLVAAFALGYWTRILFINYRKSHPAVLSGGSVLGQTISSDNCLRQTNSAQPLINPLLLCDNTQAMPTGQYRTLENKINVVISSDTVAPATPAVPAGVVSVYFRDLNSGQWISINPNAQFTPASLLKVPIMMAYYHAAEDDSSVLSQVLTYDGKTDANAGEIFKSSYDIAPGSYTADNLIKAMVVNSDNNALDVLSANLDQNSLDQIYSDLGLSIQNLSVDSITAEQYGDFFRILYNSTYLNQQYSEKALELLSGPDFPQGIRAGIASSTVQVAQKFGERTAEDQNSTVLWRELHDCGIVYYPNRPYLLCIMTKGPDFPSLIKVIQDVSQTIYTQVSQWPANSGSVQTVRL